MATVVRAREAARAEAARAKAVMVREMKAMGFVVAETAMVGVGVATVVVAAVRVAAAVRVVAMAGVRVVGTGEDEADLAERKGADWVRLCASRT